MNRLNYVLSLLLGIAAIALSQFSGPAADAKTCETVTERRCDFKGNCRDETREVCTGLSGQKKPVNPNTMSPKATGPGKLHQSAPQTKLSGPDQSRRK